MQTLINLVGNKEIAVKNMLRTCVTVADVSEKGFVAPHSTESIFASWNSTLNKQPKTDVFKPQKLLNHKKDETENFYDEIEKARRHKKWLAEIDNNIAKLKQKRYKV